MRPTSGFTLFDEGSGVLTADGEVMAETPNPYWKVPPKPQMKMAATTTGQSSCRSEEHLRQRFPSLHPLKYVSVSINRAGSAGPPSRGGGGRGLTHQQFQVLEHRAFCSELVFLRVDKEQRLLIKPSPDLRTGIFNPRESPASLG